MSEALEIQRTQEGIRALNDPDEIAVASDILNHADPDLVSWNDGVLTFHFADGDRDYRWVEDHGRFAKFERVR